MKTLNRLLILGFGIVVLAGCGQPPPDQPAADAVTDDVAAPAAADTQKLASVDADGNVAPFGFASKQPVTVADPEPAVVADAGTTASSELYGVQCVACHGADARGVQGLGLNLVDSALVLASSQEQLAEFLKVGRSADSPDSVSGVPMPGFAWMSDEQLGEITGYLKSLQN